VRVFSIEPDLLAGVDAQLARLLSDRVVTPKLWVESGTWDAAAMTQQIRRSLGLLVIDGLLVRTVELQGRRCPEIVGAGDLLRPWDDLEGSLPHASSWTALGRASLALLDESFAAVVARCPSIMAQLLTRSVQRSRALALHLAIVHVRHADVRLHMLLWHLAQRWGRMTPDGVHLPLRLTHEILAELACLRRPTASTVLSRLARRGQIARRPDGTWLLVGEPPAEV
jgi:CRP-like cAMP-binding protein